MSLLWTGMCRIYFNDCSDVKQFWSVDNGDSLSAVKCPRVVMTGNFETVVAPEPKEEPLAWFSFRKASVYRQKDGVVFVIDWTHADLRNRVQQ